MFLDNIRVFSISSTPNLSFPPEEVGIYFTNVKRANPDG